MFSKVKRALSMKSRKNPKPKKCKSESAESPTRSAKLSNHGQTVSAGTTTSPDRDPVMWVKECGYIPTILVNAAEIIKEHIEVKDLFQIQGSMEKVDYLIHVLSRNRLTMPRNISVHDVAEMVKVYLTRLSPVIVPKDIMMMLIETRNLGESADYTKPLIEYRDMTPDVFSAVHFVLQLMNKVSQSSLINGMDTRKLATVFVLDVLKPLAAVKNDEDYEENRLLRVKRLPFDIMAIEHLIRNVHIFASLPTPELCFQPIAKNETRGIETQKEKLGEKEDLQIKEEEEEDELRREGMLETHICPFQDPKFLTQTDSRHSNNIPTTNMPEWSSDGKELKTTQAAGPSAQCSTNTCNRTVDSSSNATPPVAHDPGVRLHRNRQSQRDISKSPSKTTIRSKRRSDSFTSKYSFDRRTPKRAISPPKKQLQIRQASNTSMPTLSYRARHESTKASSPKDRDSEHRTPWKSRSSRGPLMRTGRKGKKHKSTSAMGQTNSMFIRDEELEPWDGTSTTCSDDSSLMERSINNPNTFHFLNEYRMTFKPAGNVSKIMLASSVSSNQLQSSSASKYARRHRNVKRVTARKPLCPVTQRSLKNSEFTTEMNTLGGIDQSDVIRVETTRPNLKENSDQLEPASTSGSETLDPSPKQIQASMPLSTHTLSQRFGKPKTNAVELQLRKPKTITVKHHRRPVKHRSVSYPVHTKMIPNSIEFQEGADHSYRESDNVGYLVDIFLITIAILLAACICYCYIFYY